MDIEWDATKAESNLRKHGICFADAELVFYDLMAVGTFDGREHYGEDRWAIIGRAGEALLYVVYTIRHEDTVRLISARKANAQERTRYHQANA